MASKLKNIRVSNLIQNLYSLMADNHREEQRRLESLEAKVANQKLILRVVHYFLQHPEESEKYKLEISNLVDSDVSVTFPYKKLRSIDKVDADFDKNLKLPYVVHKGKKLYFPNSWSIQNMISAYTNFIESENIIGGDYKEKSPHRYESETFAVKEGDILIDAGCAEALFSLDKIDMVSKLYLIESDPERIPSLNATFAPYRDKVKIINKSVADTDSDSTITLSSVFEENPSASFFIKMDIEGYETIVVKNAETSLKNYQGEIKMACCTYHKYFDAEVLKDLFSSINFDTEFSDGYMLFAYDELKPPFFRKGVIRARNSAPHPSF